MFYGQNCSGRLGERKTVISIVGSKNDFNFVKFLDEFKIKKIKKELNKNYFSIALELARKYNIKVSLVIIQSSESGGWRSIIENYPKWFSKLYGIVCFKALKPIINKNVYLQMDREYDIKTQSIAAETIRKLSSDFNIKIKDNDIYIRKEKEHPSARIIIADLFARGCFRNYDCSSLIMNKKLDIKNEIKNIFRR